MTRASTVPPGSVPKTSLNNGLKMPMLGFGVLQVTDQKECERSVMDGRIIDAGFTDTAYNAVAEWFGHRRSDMTRDVYGPSARAYRKSPAYGQDWLTQAFCKPRLSRSSRTTHQPSA